MCASKMAKTEALTSNRFNFFITSEICLFHLFRFARSGSCSGSFSRFFISMNTVSEISFTMKLAKEKSLKLNRCPPFEPETSLSHVPRYPTALVNHRPHRFTQTLPPVTMMIQVAEGSTLIHKPSSVPDSLALLSSWLINSSPSLSLTPFPNQWPPQASSTTKEARAKTLMSLLDSLLSPLDRSPIRLLPSPSFKTRGPSLSPLWPRWFPFNLLQKSRFDPNLSLFFLSKFLSRFMNPIDQGHQLEHNPPLLLDWYTIYLRTLPLEPPRAIILEIKILKKIGIMILPPRSGDYRSFFNFLSPPPLIFELIQVHIKKFMDNFQTFKTLKKNGIMTPSPRRGSHRSFSNLLNLTVSFVEHFSKSPYALFARAVYDHSLVEDFAKPVFMVESAMASTDFSNIANLLRLSISLENSWSLYLYSCCIFFASVCMNFPLLRS
ncbi:unnamed protein product [Arabidopsis halleri]